MTQNVVKKWHKAKKYQGGHFVLIDLCKRKKLIAHRVGFKLTPRFTC